MTATTKSGRRAATVPREVEIDLGDWGPKGSTVADLDGRRVLIDRGIPGEHVAALIERRGRHWRGMVHDVIEAAAERVTPPCPYYSLGCGGCQWQHLSYEAQLAEKCRVLERELAGVGIHHPIDTVHAMDDPWRYRRTAAIAIGWEAGFRPRGRRGIIEIRDCLISHPLIGRFADQLNNVLRARALPNYHGKMWLDCTVAGTEQDPGLQVVIQGIEGLTLQSHPELPDVANVLAGLDAVVTVAFRHRSGDSRVLIGDLMGRIHVGERWMYLPAGMFFQTNLRMVPRVIQRMRALILAQAVDQAADIYGGVGTFGLALADLVGHMTLVELNPQALEAASRTAEEWGLTNISFVGSHAEHVSPNLPCLDLAIVDPPRSGLDSRVVDALVARPVRQLFYLSCSPPSLCRDLAVLGAGAYRLDSLEIFDFYPQTYHVECLAVLTPQ